ncbi:MAG TPA: hypothetical protein ENK33_09135 [Desulfobacterales bacterium]|nr:hypothetical protein [Desulfobacterales bacterium]
MKGQPVIILIVATSFGEVDWILPALTRFKEANPGWRLITLFGHKLIFDILRTNTTLYQKFDAVSDLNVVPQELDSLLQDEINPEDVRLILKDYNRDEFAPYKTELAARCPQALVINYPHSNHIYSRRNEPVTECKEPDDHSRHDFFILSSPNDISHWSRLAHHKKIKSFGYPRYDSWWIKCLIESEELQKSDEAQLAGRHNPVFFYISRGPHPNYLNADDYQYLLSSFMEKAMSYPGSFVLIKAHPRQNIEELHRLLSPYDQDRWMISGLHLMQLSALSDVVVSGWSSGILDALSVGKPVIEFWRFNGRDPDCRRDSKGAYTTIYRELNLAAPANTAAELGNLLQEALTDPDDQRWQIQRQAFAAHCHQTDNAAGALADFFLQEAEKRRQPAKKKKAGERYSIVQAMLNHVEKMAEDGDLTGGRRWLEFMLQEFPSDSRVHNSLGVILFNTGEVIPAVDLLVKSLNLNEDYLEATVNLIQILMTLDRDKDAGELAASFAKRQDDENMRRFLRELEESLSAEQFNHIRQTLSSLAGN